MREYSLLAVVSVVCVLLLDRALHTHVVRRSEYWCAIGIMFVFKIPSNGYLTWRPIVLYNPAHFLGIRLWTIPVEDFFYGYGLITLTIVLWEFFLRKETSR